MIRFRSALILWVVLSIALLPAGMGAMAVQSGMGHLGRTVVSMSDAGDPSGMPADRTMNDCQGSSGCAWKCFVFCNLSFEPKVHHPPFGETEFFFPQKVVDSQKTQPPLRPPRA